MHELISPEQAETIVRGAAIVLAACGVVGGAVAAAFVRPWRAAAVVGGMAIVAGGLVYTLWLLYNAIIARLGLDSVKALLINLGIFILVGLAYGVLTAALWRWAARQMHGASRSG